MINHNYYELVNQLIDINYQVSAPDPKMTEEKKQIITSITGEQKKIEENANDQIREFRVQQKEKLKKIRDDKSYLVYEVEVEFNGLRAFIVEYSGRLEKLLREYKIPNMASEQEMQDTQDITINFEEIKETKLRIISLLEEITPI